MEAGLAQQRSLLQVQEIYNEVQNLKDKLSNLPERQEIIKINEQLPKVKQRLNQLNYQLEEQELILSRLADDIKVTAKRRDRDKELLQTTSSPKEAQGFESEIASLTARIESLEEQQLEVLEKVDEHKPTVDKFRSAVSSLEQKEKDLKQSMVNAQEKTKTDIADLAKKMENIKATIKPELWSKFSQVVAKNNGLGAASLSAGTCGGCNLKLTVSDLKQIRETPISEMISCPECGVILVRNSES